MDFRLLTISVTLNDLERVMAVILRPSTEFGMFGGQFFPSGWRHTHNVCDKNVVQII